MSRGRRRAWRNRHRVKLGPTWITVLVMLLVASLLFTGAVLLGSHLRRQAEQFGSVDTDDTTALPDYNAENVPEIIARAALPGETPEALGPLSRMVIAYPQGSDGDVVEVEVQYDESYNAYCIVLRDEEGRLSYRSTLREYIVGANENLEGAPELSDIAELFGDTYLSGIFHVKYNTVDASIRSDVRSYELALIAEAAEAGLDDIVIVGPELNADSVEFCTELRARLPGSCRVGLALGEVFLGSDTAREVLVRIGGAFDFIALDLSGCTDATEEYITEKIYGVQTVVGIYHARILLPNIKGLAIAAIEAGAVNVAEIYTFAETSDVDAVTTNE